MTVLSMGPPQAIDAVSEAMGMGADEGILLTDRAFAVPVRDLPGDFVEHLADGFSHDLHGPTSSPAESGNLLILTAWQGSAG